MTFTFNGQKLELILLTLAGSRLYGTYFNGKGTDREHPFTPGKVSDYDLRGIFIAPPETKVGLLGSIEHIEVKQNKDGNVSKEHENLIIQLNEKLGTNIALNEDIALFEIKKFIDMAKDANPNILDILYTDKDAIKFISDKGTKLLDNKDIFLSTKTKHTFSGYAFAQLNKLKSKKKMIVKYPKINEVVNILKKSFNKDINYTFLSDNFGSVGTYITELTREEINLLPKNTSLGWDEFIEKNNTLTSEEWSIYRKPQSVEFCACKDLRGKRIDINSMISDISIKEFLLSSAGFRPISKTQLNIFTSENAKGIFTPEGRIRSNPPKEVNEFCFQLSFNANEYDKVLAEQKKLWEWKIGRNEKRNELEKRFLYDTKFASHLIRLLIGAKSILTEGTYNPRLEGENLKLVMDVLTGKFTYDEVMEMAESMNNKLDSFYKMSKLPKSANIKKANQLLIELSF